MKRRKWRMRRGRIKEEGKKPEERKIKKILPHTDQNIKRRAA
jgi:hypothetical protein